MICPNSYVILIASYKCPVLIKKINRAREREREIERERETERERERERKREGGEELKQKHLHPMCIV